jgi:hypothetical protein
MALMKGAAQGKAIVEFPGFFVTEDGKVFDSEGVQRKEYLIGIPKYKAVSLRHPVTGKWVLRTTHRLMCKAFHPNPNNLPMVNHKNENKMDNRKDNLEWCTRSYNTLHSINGSNPRKARRRLTKYSIAERQAHVAEYQRRNSGGKTYSKRKTYTELNISPFQFDEWLRRYA